MKPTLWRHKTEKQWTISFQNSIFKIVVEVVAHRLHLSVSEKEETEANLNLPLHSDMKDGIRNICRKNIKGNL